ncbi:NAD binding domain of 6-phosphogluconate dehydrogenase family protein [Mycobacterium xenopi 3993]|nr:NAD binding domain of 6-phosphogluconate dehydrogenase family protein [Mycobacterium xenopi 3993]
MVVTMLAGDEAVEEVTLGEHGILASLASGATHVSASTISVGLSKRLAAAHAEAGQQYVAAPVFGRPEAASAAKLFVVAAGAPQVLDPLTPLFDAIGQRTFVVSEQPHTANLVKLSGNFLIASVIESLARRSRSSPRAGWTRCSTSTSSPRRCSARRPTRPTGADRTPAIPAGRLCGHPGAQRHQTGTCRR